MKRLIIVLIVALLITGCATPKFVIPDDPVFTKFRVYQVEGGVCLDEQGLTALRDNVKALRESADAMRKILTDIQKGQ